MANPTTSIYLNSQVPTPAAGKQNIVFASDNATPQQSITATDPVMVGDSGSGGLQGNAPAPGAGDAAAAKFLSAAGTWLVPAAGGGSGLSAIGLVVDGGGSVPATGAKGFIQVPYGCTITGWTIIGDQTGSAVFGVSKGTYAAFPTVSSIVASAPPTLTSAQKATSTTLTGWTTAITGGDILAFTLTSISVCTRVILELQVTQGGGGGGGAITSVALSVPAWASVTGSPITGGAGNLTLGLPAFVASGGSHAPGVVPDPGASAGSTKFLREDATWAVPTGSSIFFGQGDASATAGNTTITLGSTPLAHSVSVFVNASIVRPSTLTIAGAVITLPGALSTSDIVVVNWSTSNATPGGIALS
jgi:hypothetical protein